MTKLINKTEDALNGEHYNTRTCRVCARELHCVRFTTRIYTRKRTGERVKVFTNICKECKAHYDAIRYANGKAGTISKERMKEWYQENREAHNAKCSARRRRKNKRKVS